jgi:hypothetical protein
MARDGLPNWKNQKTILNWQSEKLGPLSIVLDEGFVPLLNRPVRRLRAMGADGTQHGKISYVPRFNNKNDTIYISNVQTKPGSRKKGVASSLFCVLSALEKKKLVLVPCNIAKKKEIYQKLGFRKSWLEVNGKKRPYLVLDKKPGLKPQGIEKGFADAKFRKFFIK